MTMCNNLQSLEVNLSFLKCAYTLSLSTLRYSYAFYIQFCLIDTLLNYVKNSFSTLTSEVLMWLHAECGCSYSVHEQSGFLEVCAEIMFICDTATTNTTYNVTISTVEDSATSELKLHNREYSYPFAALMTTLFSKLLCQ